VCGLTTKQRAKLEALTAALEKLPMPELIMESARLRCPLVDGDLDESGKKRMRFAAGGAAAAKKLLAYISVLRSVDGQRIANNRRIDGLVQHEDGLRRTDPLDSGQFSVLINRLSGEQEVFLHFFSICATRIATFLPIAARAAGYKVPKADTDILDSYWPLRHHYEHFEDRLPGGKNDHLTVAETHNENEWRVNMGLVTDKQGRFVIEGKTIDVTTRGLGAIEDVVQRTCESIYANALEEVCKHFLANPSDIPDPASLQQSHKVSLGGGPPKETSSA
jgi:hypothetical protein